VFDSRRWLELFLDTGALARPQIRATSNVLTYNLGLGSIGGLINRNTDVVETFFTRVDVTAEFTFLVTKMSPYLDRLPWKEFRRLLK